MHTYYTLTARSPRYGDTPMGRFDTQEDVEAYAATFAPGTMILIVKHSGTERTNTFCGVI